MYVYAHNYRLFSKSQRLNKNQSANFEKKRGGITELQKEKEKEILLHFQRANSVKQIFGRITTAISFLRGPID